MNNNVPFILALIPDYCCGGGHCGPLPGYTFKCPSCGKESGCRTGDYLVPGQSLVCFFCKQRMEAVEEISEFEFKFIFVADPEQTSSDESQIQRTGS